MKNQLFNTKTEINNTVDIVIVGGGLSGLTAALKLRSRDPTLKVRILESTNSLGGQMRSMPCCDIGGKWFTERQRYLCCLLKQLNISYRRRQSQASNLKYASDFKGLVGLLARFELHRYINELDLNIYTFNSDIKRRKRSIIGRVYASMKSHIDGRLFFSTSRKYMANLVLLISGVNAENISYKDFMSICYTTGSLRSYIDLFIDIPSTLLEFSTSELMNAMLKNLEDVEILYNHEVHEINQMQGYVKVHDSENRCHVASAVIVAIPLNHLRDIYFWPPIPDEMQNDSMIADNRKYIITSFLAKYKYSIWQLKNYSGHIINNDPFMVAYEYYNAIITGYIVHEEDMDGAIRNKILKVLAKNFGKEMLLPFSYVQRHVELDNKVHAPMITPWKRVIWSSSACAATYYRGCFDGAIQSGIKAALNAVLVVRPQIINWHDIVEIRCNNNPHPRNGGSWLQAFSSFNLYNVSVYAVTLFGLVLIIRRTCRTQES